MCIVDINLQLLLLIIIVDLLTLDSLGFKVKQWGVLILRDLELVAICVLDCHCFIVHVHFVAASHDPTNTDNIFGNGWHHLHLFQLEPVSIIGFQSKYSLLTHFHFTLVSNNDCIVCCLEVG